MKTSLQAESDIDGIPSATAGRSLRAGVILLSHAVIDAYSAIVPAMLGIIEAHCHLEASESSLVVAAMSIVSGMAQPVCAVLSDRYDSRIFGGLGLAVGAVFLCLLGRVATFPGLLLLVIAGYFGIGIFHPIAASSIGEISNRWRSLAMSGFFMAGMLGAALGARFLPLYVGDSDGLWRLEYLIIPGVVVAVLLHRSIRNVSHRSVGHAAMLSESGESQRRWKMVWILYIATTLRAAVYITLQYMFVRWAQFNTANDNPGLTDRQVVDVAAPLVGEMISMMILGMAIGGLAAGVLIRQGREKLPLILVPLAFSPVIVSLPHSPESVAKWLGLLAGVGFASMSPVALAVAQRLLPHRTSLASSMMLGAAWAVAAIGPLLAQPAIGWIGINGVFIVCGVVLAVSGLLAMGLKSSLLSASVKIQ